MIEVIVMTITMMMTTAAGIDDDIEKDNIECKSDAGAEGMDGMTELWLWLRKGVEENVTGKSIIFLTK